jgi:hypothetical protein
VAKGMSAARTGASTFRTLVTILVTVVLLAVFTALFAGADPAFDHLLGVVLPTVDEGTVFRWIGSFLLLALGTIGAMYLRAAPLPPDAEPAAPRTWRRIDWALPVGALVLLFAAFVGVQATVLFGGNDHVLSVPSLTYAEYARTGFWQLLVVTILTLVVLGVAARKASRATGTDRGWLRVLLGALAVLTLVIVASALYRMQTYEQAYGFTRLRILVSACELWFGVVFALVLVAGIRLRTRATWLPRAVLASAMLALLGVAALNPDRFIAEQNVTRYEQTGKIDLSYLADLSADAVPALNRLPEPQRTCALRWIALGVTADATNGWIGWNLGRAQAEDLLVGYVPAPFETCVPAYLNPRP